ncbi:MAG: hypothetical protein J6I66_07415 [Lachnospiraceae bacterium]|nr:hypothetical protein [Lachnospiraceae bacterium]
MKDISTGKINKTSAAIVVILLTVAAVCMLFYANISVPFMMDDIWYSTNLATGNTLSGLGDVIESQVWHYLNWGGRSITHAFLQLSLMCGERGADVINTVLTIVLVMEMSHLSDAGFLKKRSSRKLFLYSLMFGLLIACCPNLRMSMLWQAGCANYVYSSVWILAFYIVYIRAMDQGTKDLPLSEVFMVPLGFITGWSTENMGPSACAVAALITFMMYKKGNAKGRRLVWMLEGVITSLAGSAICILAPGNSVRSMDSVDDLALTFPERLLQMLKGIGDYLFPALVILVFSIILYKMTVKDRIPAFVLYLLLGALLSYGAMIMSPHYPDRAAFGTCVLIEAASGALMVRALSDEKENRFEAVTIVMLLSASAVLLYVLV